MRCGIAWSNWGLDVIKKTVAATERDRETCAKLASVGRWLAALGLASAGLPGRDRIEHQDGAALWTLAGRQPLLGVLPHGHWRTSTLIAALRHDRIGAPLLIDGPMDGVMFLAYVQQVLCAELRPNDLVICDNLSCHKVSGVLEAITACGAELRYLPAYSPDLNPIEMAFSKLKALLRKATARNLPGLIKAAASALDSFSPDQCRNFFRHAEYATN